MEKKNTPSPLQKSGNGKNVASKNSKGSEKSVRNADTPLGNEKSKSDNVEESTSPIKKQEPTMTGRRYRALFRGRLKKKVNASSNDEELVVVGCSGCSRRAPADNDDVRDGIEDSPPHANSDLKTQPVGETSLEKGADSPLKSTRDTEKMVLDASPMVETGNDNVIGSPETQKLPDSKTSLETDTDFPLKRKRDTAGISLDACDIVGNAYECVMSSDKVIPSPSRCENNNQPETCSTCEKRQRVDGDFENLSVSSCIPQPVQESDHMAKDMEETGPNLQETVGAQDASSLPSSLAGTQPDLAANIEDRNITTVAQRQEAIGVEVASSLPSSLVGTQPDLATNTEGQNNTTVSPLYTAGSEAVETGGSPLSDQDSSPLPFSSLGSHHDAGVNTEGINDTTITEPHTTGSDACEMEIAKPILLVEQPTLANNLVQIARAVVVEPSAGVTAPIQSLFNNGTGQGPVQQVPHVPFPVFNDPFQYELEKLRRESENIKKTFQDKKFVLKDDLKRKVAELQAEYEKNFHELDTEQKTRTMENDKNWNLVLKNKLLANAFSFKSTDKNASRSSAAPMGRIQLLAQRVAEQNALMSLMASTPTLAPSPTLAPPLQPQASSFFSPAPWPSVLPRNSALCPMPQPRQPLISNTGPSPSVTPATTPVVNVRLRSPAPHLNAYRSSSSIPTATTTLTSPSLPQALTYANVLLQQQLQQQQNSGSGLQGSNDVVCLSDDE